MFHQKESSVSPEEFKKSERRKRKKKNVQMDNSNTHNEKMKKMFFKLTVLSKEKWIEKQCHF